MKNVLMGNYFLLSLLGQNEKLMKNHHSSVSVLMSFILFVVYFEPKDNMKNRNNIQDFSDPFRKNIKLLILKNQATKTDD